MFEDLTDDKIRRLAEEITGRSLRPVHRQAAPSAAELREARADALQGRERDHFDRWRQVMERHGFGYMTPEQLDAHPLVGPMKVPAGIGDVHQGSDLTVDGSGTVYKLKPHEEAQWRRFGRYAEAFTPGDLIALFGDSPERFAEWIEDHTTRRHYRQQGLAIPTGLRAPLLRKGQRRPGGKIVIARR